MLQTNPQTDPIVEILRLAYRRGIAIRQGQEKSVEPTNMPFITEENIVSGLEGSLTGEPKIDPTNCKGDGNPLPSTISHG